MTRAARGALVISTTFVPVASGAGNESFNKQIRRFAMRCKCIKKNNLQAVNDPHAEIRKQALVVVPKLLVKDPQVGRTHLLYEGEKNLGLVKVSEEFLQGETETRCIRVHCLGREMRGAVKVFASVAGTWRDVGDSAVCDSCTLHSGAVYTFR